MTGFFFDGYWLAFAAGILVYRRVSYGTARSRWRTRALLAAGALYAVFILPGEVVVDRDLVTSMGFAAFLFAMHRWDREVAPAPALGPLATGQTHGSSTIENRLSIANLRQVCQGDDVRRP